jgi:hypothetical protein
MVGKRQGTSGSGVYRGKALKALDEVTGRLNVQQWIVASSTALAMSACASTQLADKQIDAAGKRFDPPPPNLATLYVIQGPCMPSTAQPVGPVLVFQQGNCGTYDAMVMGPEQKAASLGRLGAKNWTSDNILPGTYTIWCDPGGRHKLQVSAKAGETVFVSLLRTVDGQCAPWIQNDQRGRAGVLEGQRVQLPPRL